MGLERKGADCSASGRIMGGVIENYLENYVITECSYTQDVTYVATVASDAVRVGISRLKYGAQLCDSGRSLRAASALPYKYETTPCRLTSIQGRG